MKKTNLNKIVYIDKQNFQELPTIPIYQKATASDFNQIKNIVNLTVDELNLNVSTELENLNNSTVKINSNQIIDGIKTFINSGGAITFNSENQSQYLEFKNDNVSISFFGKLNESNNDISIVSNSGKLIFSATQGCFFESPISGIQNPINDDSPTNKIYVDTKDSQLNSLILNLENLLNSLANDFNKLRPFNFKGKYDPNTTYSKNDAVDNPKGYLFISVIDNNLNNSLDDENSWISAGPQIDLTNYYSKIEIDQKLNLKSNKDEVVDLTSNQRITGSKTFNAETKIDGTNNLYFGDNAWMRNNGDGVEIVTNNNTPFKTYINGTHAFEISSTGVNVYDKKISRLGTPTANTDAANKSYVDTSIAGIDVSGKADKTYVDAELALKADKTAIDTINVELGVNSTNISQNSADILLKANQTDLDSINIEVASNKTNIAKNSNDILTKASLVDGKLDVPNNGGIKTTQNIELLSTSLNKQNTVKIVSSRNGSGYRNWTSLEFIDRDGTTDTKKASLEYRPEGLYSVGCALVPDSDDCWTSKKYVDDAIVQKVLTYQVNKLVVPINASTDTSTTINDRVVKVVYKEYTSIGDSVVASTTAGFGYLNVSIIRKKSDNSWGIVYNDEFNEVYITSTNQIRFNIKTLTGYTDEIKLTIKHN